MPKVEKTCACGCGTAFLVWPSQPKKYASLACRPYPGHWVPGPRACRPCGESFQPVSARQVACKRCVPSRESRSRLARYGLTEAGWRTLIDRFDGKCWVCRTRVATCTDHDHETGRVRGALRRTCNMALHYVENTGWMERAHAYLAVEEVIDH